MNWMAGICAPSCFFFFPCLPAEDICVFTISWKKLKAWCSLCARVRQSERHTKFACESVRLLHVEQLKCFEQKRTAFTRPGREFIEGLFVSSVLLKKKKKSILELFWLSRCRSSTVSIDCVVFCSFFLISCGISCFYVLFWLHPGVQMSILRWHRLSVLWKNWMFNQESGEEPGSISQNLEHEIAGNASQENSNLKTQNLDFTHQNSEVTEQAVEFINPNVVGVAHKPGLLTRSLSEPCSHSEVRTVSCPRRPKGCGRTVHQSCCSELGVNAILQVDNSSEGDDSFLQREGSQRRSRRRFRRINPRGERELITDSQEPSGYTTVRVIWW